MKEKWPTIWLDSTDSTQNEALRRIDSLANMSVVAARCQTQGRGQRGNVWKSANGDNLTFSAVLKFDTGNGSPDLCPPLPATSQFQISMAASCAVAQFIGSKGIASKIKWPNDIWCSARKICGILVENLLEGRLVKRSIVGIGINVNQIEFDPSLPNPVSLRMLTGAHHDIEQCIEAFMPIFASKIALIGSKELSEEYHSRLYQLDRPCQYVNCKTGLPFTGTIRGISPEGLLKVELPDSSISLFAFKEISYII